MRTGKLTHYDAASRHRRVEHLLVLQGLAGQPLDRLRSGGLCPALRKARFEQIDFLSTFWAFDITEDSRGNLWFASLGGGLCRYEPASGERRFFAHEEGNPASLSSNAVSNVCEDRHGTLWFSTDRGGLCRYDYDTDAFRSYSLGEGMPDNVTYRVLEDSEGMLLARHQLRAGAVQPRNRKKSAPTHATTACLATSSTTTPPCAAATGNSGSADSTASSVSIPHNTISRPSPNRPSTSRD